METFDCGGKVLNTFASIINNTWIIYSGATNHMTFDSRHISSLRQSLWIGGGSLTLTDTLNLDSILIVPSLNYNLFYVPQITVALSYIVIFLPKFCVFKDIRTRHTIGYGIRRRKLYYLKLQSKIPTSYNMP